jgi:2-iminobutanoate/2-iminopropanoate deaminase
MSKRAIATDGAPKAVGPYSQAVVAGGLVFCAGQIPLTPEGKLIASDDVRDHVRRVMENVRAVLQAAGSDLDKLVKVTIFLADMADYPAVNEAYAAFVGEVPPARSAIQAAKLPLGARVEIEAIAAA